MDLRNGKEGIGEVNIREYMGPIRMYAYGAHLYVFLFLGNQQDT
jgi:hypothetical protein